MMPIHWRVLFLPCRFKYWSILRTPLQTHLEIRFSHYWEIQASLHPGKLTHIANHHNGTTRIQSRFHSWREELLKKLLFSLGVHLRLLFAAEVSLDFRCPISSSASSTSSLILFMKDSLTLSQLSQLCFRFLLLQMCKSLYPENDKQKILPLPINIYPP